MSIAFDEPDLDTLVRKRIEQWRSGQAPDAAAFLDEHPELRDSKSLVLDLIYEEICLRSESGDTLVKSTFCDRFPAYRQSIVKMLEVKEHLDRCPPEDEMAACRWPEAGEHFMGYDVVGPLGRGALARVYLAREPALGNRSVVIKVSRFGAREAETLGKLSHPNIVPIHSVRHDDETGWTTICMPLVGTATVVDLLDAAFGQGEPLIGGELVTRVATRTRPIDQEMQPPSAPELRQWRSTYADAVARLGLQLAEGLDAAHAAGVMHRDIKPSNVLLSWSGRPMLLDFNLSTDQSLASERIGGTLAYMAPELIASLLHDGGTDARRFDARADVYSLGAVLYELLTGKLPARPVDAEALPANAYAPWLECKNFRVPSISSLSKHVDRRLEAIVLKCLAANPAERYATAADLAHDLRAYLAPLPRCLRLIKRRPRATFLAAVVLLAAVAACVAFVSALPTREQRLMAAAVTCYEQGNPKAAEERLREIIDADPGSVEARFALAQTLRMQERWLEARDMLLPLTGLNPQWINALAGDCAFQERRFADASRDFRAAYAAGNRDPEFLVRYAFSERQAGEMRHCLSLYNEAITATPRHADALRGRAMAYWSKSSDKSPIDLRAVDDAELACEVDPCLKSYYVAVLVYGRAIALRPELIEPGARHLKEAIEAGMPAHLLKQPSLNPLCERVIMESPGLTPQENRELRIETEPDEPLPRTLRWDAFLSQISSGK